MSGEIQIQQRQKCNHGWTQMNTDKKQLSSWLYTCKNSLSGIKLWRSFRASRGILTTPTALSHSAQGWSEATTLGSRTNNFIAPFRSPLASGRGLGVGDNKEQDSKFFRPLRDLNSLIRFDPSAEALGYYLGKLSWKSFTEGCHG